MEMDVSDVLKQGQDVDADEWSMNDPRTVLHWYDFLCPFCYVAQARTAILVRHGLRVVELPFQAHPDIPTGGVAARQRIGAMYVMLAREAKEAGLSLYWPARLPNTRNALAAAEWVRRHEPDAFAKLHKDLFDAHFVLGEDLGDSAVVDRHAAESGVDLPPLHIALADGSAMAAVSASELAARSFGVRGTPAWRAGERVIEGLLPNAAFERLAHDVMRVPKS
jgi:predicted DsbA family dithiol-disulfide isomerase